MEKDNDIIKKAIEDDFYSFSIPVDFTDKVMQQVQAIASTKKIIKPLISKSTWIKVGIIAVFVFIFSFRIDIQNIALELPFGLTLPKLNFSDFKLTIKLFAIITSILVLMTLLDVIYRRIRNNV